jgi:hypothetical protein
MVGATWPRRARHVGRGDGAWMAVQCKERGPRCVDRRTEASLGVRAQRGRATDGARTPARAPLWSARVRTVRTGTL